MSKALQLFIIPGIFELFVLILYTYHLIADKIKRNGKQKKRIGR
jgi:hypothetical protein